jgi:lipopolysaccharide transport system ATP-binding protein
MPVIRVENLSKSYRLGQIGSSTLRDDLARSWAKLRRQPDPLLRIGQEDQANRQGETIWALKDIGFEVEQGEVLGIIGRNGAGKSTLLKILSRVTAPTSGVVRVKGRIASLLEVGTGFHPELTGRENIFLNGAILGMSREEVRRKFDEIVDFSGVEKFIDTPVKRYSSGMAVRLAFSVMAHLDAEIMVIDEVLAVGDQIFQKKCLGKMETMSRGGRTVLFVSHNMAAVRQLCNIGFLIDKGNIIARGNTSNVIDSYLQSKQKIETYSNLSEFDQKRKLKNHYFSWIQILGKNNEKQSEFTIGEKIKIVFCISSNENITHGLAISMIIHTFDGLQICNIVSHDSKFNVELLEGNNTFQVSLDDIRFYPGSYSMGLWLGDHSGNTTFDFVEDCIGFQIIDGGLLTSRSLPRSSGLIFLTPEWHLVHE